MHTAARRYSVKQRMQALQQVVIVIIVPTG